jgi:predicted  nucleic acid-binding Zn-ribbon protein
MGDGEEASEQTDQPPGGRAPAPVPTRKMASADNGELDSLRDEIGLLKRELAELREETQSMSTELRRELEELKSQLGV